MVTKIIKKPVARTPKAVNLESRLRLLAKAAGLKLEKQGNDWQLVDANTGTQVAASWTDDDGLTLDQIEAALRNN